MGGGGIKVIVEGLVVGENWIDDDRNKDEYGEGPIAIFKISKKLINFHGEIEVVKIYIKIKLLENKIIPIISFHEAEF